MKRFLVATLIAGTVMAHVPVITPSDRPQGDVPPIIEEKPLPPVMAKLPMIILDNPVTHIPIVLMPW
jgi:hypothetical protein